MNYFFIIISFFSIAFGASSPAKFQFNKGVDNYEAVKILKEVDEKRHDKDTDTEDLKALLKLLKGIEYPEYQRSFNNWLRQALKISSRINDLQAQKIILKKYESFEKIEQEALTLKCIGDRYSYNFRDYRKAIQFYSAALNEKTLKSKGLIPLYDNPKEKIEARSKTIDTLLFAITAENLLDSGILIQEEAEEQRENSKKAILFERAGDEFWNVFCSNGSFEAWERCVICYSKIKELNSSKFDDLKKLFQGEEVPEVVKIRFKKIDKSSDDTYKHFKILNKALEDLKLLPPTQ